MGTETRRSLLETTLGRLSAGVPVALFGADGSGRTVLCLELVTSLAQRGVRTAMFTQEPARLIRRQAESLDLPFTELLEDEQLLLFEFQQDVAHRVALHGEIAFVESVTEACADSGAVVIDSVCAVATPLLDERIRALVNGLADALVDRILVVTTGPSDDASPLTRSLRSSSGACLEVSRAADGHHRLSVEKCRLPGVASHPTGFRIGRGGVVRIEDPRAPADAPPPPSAETRPRILIVEDDRFHREQFAEWLGDDYDVEQTADGFAGVTEALTERPDLILLDLLLPRATGFEVLRSLRRAGLSCPILVVSSNLNRVTDRLKALVMGATDLVSKPVRPFELTAKVETLLRLAPSKTTFRVNLDAESLLAAEGPRVLEIAEFRDQLERACRFGDQFSLASSILAIETRTPAQRDRAVSALGESVRAEDALVNVGGRRALILLVGAGADVIHAVIERLTAALERRGMLLSGLRMRVLPARPGVTDEWESAFEELRPWTAEVARPPR